MQMFQVELSYAGHREMKFSPDGRFLAIGLRVLTFLDTAGGSPRTFPELGDVFNAVWVWYVGGRKLPSRAKLHVRTRSVFMGDFALSADGSRLVAVDCQGVYIWDTTTGELLRSGKHRRGVTAVACSPTKPILLTGDNAGQVFLWDHTGRVLTRYNWKLKQVSGLAFAPDGLRCAAIDVKGKVIVWDLDV